ncbi:MAG TPA: hydrogen gas-evolving membrane-bound hydrogenase subunit E [Coriobacteriia bacterium]|nr:hydrogen gas-evolving membrane-bound hydrogenase subunit E [Coriobacteriia bacterium]
MADTASTSTVPVRVASFALCAGVGVFLARAVLAIPEDEPGVAPLVEAALPYSGVKNPVTAVLLNFRGYDTLLEIAVLVLATIGVLSLAVGRAEVLPRVAERADPVLSALARFLAPVMVLISGYLLWVGEFGPGGAFQAGSVIGAAGVLLALSGHARLSWMSGFALRVMTGVGFVVFLGTAIGSMLASGMLLEYPPGMAKDLIVVIEVWLTLSIGAILISLFLASATPVEELRGRMEEHR